jgi:WXG100 family type VII secretion target
MREIEVDTDALQKQLNQFREDAEQIVQTLNLLSQTVDELNPMWVGPAHHFFYEQYMSDHEEFEEFMKALLTIENHFEDARKQYDVCENEVGSIVASINS